MQTKEPQKGPDKSRPPQQQRSVETKKKIIAAATGLFREKGYFQTNTKEIAKVAGVATGSFYSYFTDKRQVFVEAYYASYYNFRDILTEGIGALLDTDLDRREMIRRMILLILDAHNLFDFLEPDLDILATTDADLQQLFIQINEEGISQCAFFLKQLSGRMRIEYTQAAAAVIYFSIRRIIDLIAHSQTTIPREALIAELSDMLLAYLFGAEKPGGK